MSTSFEYRPAEAATTLTALRGLPANDEGKVKILGTKLAQAQLHTLVNAEFLAAQAGIVPWIELPDGTKGVGVIGAARDKIDAPTVPPDVRTAYLAAHGLNRRIAITATPSTSTTPDIKGLLGPSGAPILEEPPPIGLLGVDDVAIALVVLGVAAICATAWYAATTKKAVAELETRKAVELSQTNGLLNLAMEQLRKTGKVQPEIVAALAPASTEEAAHSGDLGSVFGKYMPFAAVAALAVGAGYLFLSHRAAERIPILLPTREVVA